MALELPNLDDRKYKDLVEEALSMIPNYAPNWTNHNPSDPGITLIEMFAYLTEIMNYRLNRISDDNVRTFLKLINGTDWKQSKSLAEEKRDTIQEMRQTNRAVTCEDFEKLALAADVDVARAHCVPRRNLESENSDAYRIEKEGHISIVIVPKSEESNPKPDENLIQTIKDDLEPRRLLTTVVHVVKPRYFTIGVRLTLHLKRDVRENVKLKEKFLSSLRKFFHPVTGGPDGKGWPFGRYVFVSEIYELLDNLPEVDYVEKSKNSETEGFFDEIIPSEESSERLKRNDDGSLVAVEIQPDELVDFQESETEITIISPITKDKH